MDIVHIAAEMAPFAKVGGLADVLLGLSRELVRQKHRAEVILPFYDVADFSLVTSFALIETIETRWLPIEVWQGSYKGVTITALNPKSDLQYFNRGTLYGCDDDLDRFLAFSRAAVEFLARRKGTPDCIHLHDWQTAICPLLAKDLIPLPSTRFVLTIHNIAHQGHCQPHHLDAIGLCGSDYLDMGRLADNYNPNCLNLMKGGIVYSDRVTTVSPSYAQEVLAPAGGRGLESTLIKYKEKFTGILNGLDVTAWDPKSDPLLPSNFKTAKGKGRVKKALQKQLGLSQVDKPLVAVITRLVPQKGIDLIKHALQKTLAQGGQFVLLGSSPIPEIQADFEALADKYRDHPDCHLWLRYDESLAHRVYGGADILLVPSLFEPCGLTQLIAMRYGTIPVVRETGGLADTVHDLDYSERPFEEVNGYSFRDPDIGGVDSALDRALSCWKNEKGTWADLMKNSMSTESSWEEPAGRYVNLYQG